MADPAAKFRESGKYKKRTDDGHFERERVWPNGEALGLPADGASVQFDFGCPLFSNVVFLWTLSCVLDPLPRLRLLKHQNGSKPLPILM